MPTIYTTVKKPFRYHFSNGNWADVPAGAHTQCASAWGDGFRWVDPTVFPAGSLERHDAEHYGIRVPLSNVKSWEA